VFINCPFDEEYRGVFEALIFALRALGFWPRSARELDDGGEVRIEKLYRIIQECRFGIHDISRTTLDKANRLPRFNMPLELGMFLGAKRYGSAPQKEKRILILDTEQYRYQKFISDLAGMDIHAHHNDPFKAISETRDWLANVADRELISGRRLQTLYREFRKKLPAVAKERGLNVSRLSYADYERLVAGWLMETE
jgi:hypothetical protein